MRTIIYKALLITSICVAFAACKSVQGLSKEEKSALITNKLESQNYTFTPRTAIPVSGKTINLTPSYYSLRVTNDSVIAFLPYFGRAYTAPMDPSEGGIKFTSTDFKYQIGERKKGMWNISIETSDTQARARLTLSVSDNGYASLTVLDNNRQSISFYGEIEE